MSCPRYLTMLQKRAKDLRTETFHQMVSPRRTETFHQRVSPRRMETFHQRVSPRRTETFHQTVSPRLTEIHRMAQRTGLLLPIMISCGSRLAAALGQAEILLLEMLPEICWEMILTPMKDKNHNFSVFQAVRWVVPYRLMRVVGEPIPQIQML